MVDRGSPASLPIAGARARRGSADFGARSGLADRTPLVVLSPSTLHVVAVPLIILSLLATGFILVYLKEILVPLVVATLFVYLLRPIVNLLTQPFANCCHSRLLDDGNSYTSLKEKTTPGDVDTARARHERMERNKDRERQATRPAPKRALMPAAIGSAAPIITSGHPAAGSASPSGRRGPRRVKSPTRLPQGITVCRTWRFTQCPRWFGVAVALLVAFGVLSSIVLLVADAVQSFEREDVRMFQASAIHMTNKTLTWINLMFKVDGSSLLKSIKTQVPVADLVQKLLLMMIDAVGNTFLILLLVLYLLFEQASHPVGTLRRKVDDQIQRYIGIKTLISAGVGFLVYLVLGVMLHIKLAHLFGIMTFLLNFVPNVGPVIATLMPLPIIVLDLTMSPTSKFLAMALPTAIHAVIGNFLEPKIFGHSLELHPVVVLMALAFWFAIWGVVGAILSIPVTAVIRIVLSHSNHPYARIVIRLLEGHIGLQDVQLIRHIGSLDMGGDSGTDIGTDEEENVGGSVSPPEPPPATASTVTLRPGATIGTDLSPPARGGGGLGSKGLPLPDLEHGEGK